MPPLVPKRKFIKPKPLHPRDYGPRHVKLRKQLLNKFPICQICNDAFSTEAHHLRYPSQTIEDYLAVCVKCHKLL